MGQPQKNPLRPVTEEEQEILNQVSRGQSEPASHVARAKALLAVAKGRSFTAAAKAAGRRSGDAVAQLVARFNEEGLAALEPRHGGGPAIKYGAAEQERILTEARRKPQLDRDGTATWSLSTLQWALRQAEDGLPEVSTYTIWLVLQANGFSWQKDVSWCETGKVQRQRKEGVVEVIDPDATAKKS
jgi:transposase